MKRLPAAALYVREGLPVSAPSIVTVLVVPQTNKSRYYKAFILVIYEPGGIQRRAKRKKDDGLETGRRVLVVHESEAQIVRLVFQWYTVGNGQTGPLPIRGIVERLTEMRVPTWRDVHKKGFKPVDFSSSPR